MSIAFILFWVDSDALALALVTPCRLPNTTCMKNRVLEIGKVVFVAFIQKRQQKELFWHYHFFGLLARSKHGIKEKRSTSSRVNNSSRTMIITKRRYKEEKKG